MESGVTLDDAPTRREDVRYGDTEVGSVSVAGCSDQGQSEDTPPPATIESETATQATARTPAHPEEVDDELPFDRQEGADVANGEI